MIQRTIQMPTPDSSCEYIHQHRQIDELRFQTDIGDINGLITNDKFCMIRRTKLQLRAKPSYPLCYHPVYQPDCQYPSDETFHPGGNHETSVEHSATTHTLSGWTTTLGPCVSIPPAMEPQPIADTKRCFRDPGSANGGGS